MKKPIIILLLCIFIFSCKSKPKIINTVVQKNDTTIDQEVWYDRGQYHLQTYVITEKGQLHSRSDGYLISGYGMKFTPYCKEIAGTYQYIAERKLSEYYTAHKAFYEIVDSVNQLNSIQPK